MNKKELLKFFCYMFLAICLIALIILGICSFFYYLVPIDFPGTVGEWLSSLSTLAGGALTLGGVGWTMKKQEEHRAEDFEIQEKRRKEDFDNQENQRKQNLAIRYQPNIKIDTIKNTSDSICIINNKKYLHVLAINTGRGEALDCKYYLQNERDNFYMMSSFLKSESSSIFIPLNEKSINLKENYLHTTIIVTYTDFLKINKYKIIAEIGISFSEKSINKIIISLTSK